jgi:hypothetical protein
MEQTNIFGDAGDGEEGVISVPADVRKGELEDFNNALPTAEEAMISESFYLYKIYDI